MTGADFLTVCLIISFAMLSAAFVLIIVRIVRGPTLPDRILALDLLVSCAVSYIAAFGIRTGFSIYVDIAIALGIVGFLSTIALARFVLRRGELSLDDGSTKKDISDA
ncbi:monovalent cation/H+ antiporter complex subunit F [Acuticoccus sp. M5D2P5]|uniref:cation:proton antiporter n=1 Tax=Acuticoccus kalidii TaxID=2910977 RepID=UPI001F0B9A88|nr:cation:proton antiporter [Acuticoccus kalidii]MCF3935595.1 monovalent cation/H+ antiporter complex subunit F [Acuticoccus kalidii]